MEPEGTALGVEHCRTNWALKAVDKIFENIQRIISNYKKFKDLMVEGKTFKGK